MELQRSSVYVLPVFTAGATAGNLQGSGQARERRSQSKVGHQWERASSVQWVARRQSWGHGEGSDCGRFEQKASRENSLHQVVTALEDMLSDGL